jgi:hypothetical protein
MSGAWRQRNLVFLQDLLERRNAGRRVASLALSRGLRNGSRQLGGAGVSIALSTTA